MRLALITQDFTPAVGGIETYSLELAKRFYQWSDYFCVIAPRNEGAVEKDQQLEFDVWRVKTKNSLLGWAALLSIPQRIHANKIDSVFHTQWMTLPVSVFMKKTGIIKNIYVAAHARELFNPFPKNSFTARLYHWYKLQMFKHVDRFFPVSDYTKGLLRNDGIPDEKIEIVINGTNPDFFKPEQPDNSIVKELGLTDKKVLLTITRLVSRKGIDTVLRAMPGIVHEFPDVKYVVVGEGPQGQELKKITSELGLEKHVIFAGKVPYDRIVDYYNLCDIFIMPSKTEIPDVEGFGIVFLEANACAKPVIGSKSGGIPSAVLDNQTGLLVKEGSISELEAATIKLLKDSELAEQLGQNGRKRVLEQANWDASARRIFSMIQKD